MTYSSLQKLLEQEWVRENYITSHMSGTKPPTYWNVYYGVVILSRLPVLQFGICDFPSTMGRFLLTATLNIGGELVSRTLVDLSIATCC